MSSSPSDLARLDSDRTGSRRASPRSSTLNQRSMSNTVLIFIALLRGQFAAQDNRMPIVGGSFRYAKEQSGCDVEIAGPRAKATERLYRIPG